MGERLRLLVCGSRDWRDMGAIQRFLSDVERKRLRLSRPVPLLIHGGARGADEIAGLFGERLGWEIAVYPASWGLHGRAAGPMRNARMLADGRPTWGASFGALERMGRRTGTGDMVARLRAARIPVRSFGA